MSSVKYLISLSEKLYARRIHKELSKLYKVKVSGEKGGILDNVHLKVDDSFTFELHLDTDDANAFLLKQGDKLEIIK